MSNPSEMGSSYVHKPQFNIHFIEVNMAALRAISYFAPAKTSLYW